MRRLIPAALFVVGACGHSPDPAPQHGPAGQAAPADIASGTQPPQPPQRFTALGTEPFWSAQVDGARLTYRTPEDQRGQTITVSRTVTGSQVELRGTLGHAELVLTVRAGVCSDGMSDVVYPFTVLRLLGADQQRGCARAD